MFSENDPYIGIDLDGCRNQDTGKLDNWAAELIRLLNSYTEISPSQTGVKVIIKGSLAGKQNHFTFHGHEAEVYKTGRYFALTGQRVNDVSPDIWVRQEQVNVLVPNESFRDDKEFVSIPREDDAAAKAVDEITDANLILKIESSAQGEKFKQLMAGSTAGYAGYFAASGALCAILAQWTRCNASRINTIYQMSGLYEESWWNERAYSGGRTRADVTISQNSR